VQVPIAQKFRDLDEASIEESIKTLSEAMYNSSSAVRSKITFCITASSANLQYILKYGEQYKIMDKGFVWILSGASGQVESTVADVHALSKGDFRRLFAGFMNFGGVVLPNKIHKAIATSNPDMMASSELNKWGAASGAAATAAANGRSWKDEVYSQANSGVGDSGNVYTYDAVWATAIGLASAMQANDMKNLHEHIRSCGGKGPFESASGKVLFDEVGDRSFEGLTFSLSNLIPPAATDEAGFNWSTFEYSGAYSWRTIGTWEASGGFSRVSDPSVVPYWTGGVRTWTPPPDSFEDPSQSDAAPSAPTPPTIITKEVIEKARPVNLLAVVLPTVAIVLVSVLAAYCLYKISTKPRDDEAEQFKQDCNRLRQRLKLTKQDGYILSTENNMWASRKSVVIPKTQMDCIVRLSRLEPFDTNVFDAFCVLLVDNEYTSHSTGSQLEEVAAMLVLKGSKHADSTGQAAVAGEQLVGSSFGSGDMGVRLDKQMRFVKEWLLEISTVILAQLSVENIDEHLYAATGMAEERQERSRLSCVCEQRYKSQQKLYAYFVKYVLALRIWRDDSFALFKELKILVQVLMNQLAGKCHERFRELSLDADGQQLCNFSWLPDTGELDRSQAGMLHGSAHDMQTSNEVRQDDDLVQAIRLNRGDAAEAQLERDTPALGYALAAAGLQVDTDEAIFIMQLHRRGKLLNEAFRSTVIDVLVNTAANEGGLNSPVRSGSRDFDKDIWYSGSDHASGHSTISLAPAMISFQPDAIISSGQNGAKSSLSGTADVETGQTSLARSNSIAELTEVSTLTEGNAGVMYICMYVCMLHVCM